MCSENEPKGELMFFSIERSALVFCTLCTFAVTLLAGRLAFAGPAILDDQGVREAAQPIVHTMFCSEAIERSEKPPVRTTIVVNMQPSTYIVESGTVTSKLLGTCGSDSPSSASNALGGTVDIHSFAAGGSLCTKPNGSVQFTVFHDRVLGQSRYATLTIQGVNYNCSL
jgi:hypothetical protein